MFALIASLVLQAASPPPDPVPQPAGAEFVVELRDGRTLRGALGDLAGGRLGISTSAAADGQQQVALDDVVLIEALPAPPPSAPAAPPPSGHDVPVVPPAPDLLFLAGVPPPGGNAPGVGDRLVGAIAGGDKFGLRFTLAGGPTISVPFDGIERLLPRADRPVDRLALLAGGGADDRLWRRGAGGNLDNLDSLTGVLDRFEGGKLVFEGALGPLTFDLSEVLAVVFAPGAAEPPPLEGTPVLVRLAAGSRLAAGLIGIERGALILSTRCAPRLELPLAQLGALVVRGGGRTLLAELAPSSSKEWPSVGRPEDFLFPWRADLSVTGRLLSVGGVPRASGLGVHSNCELSFAIPPSLDTLRVTVGLSDEVAELPVRGSVICEVLVDGQSRASSGVLHAGDAPVILRVTGLRSAHELRLVTGDAGDDDAGDRVGWVDGILLGSVP